MTRAQEPRLMDCSTCGGIGYIVAVTADPLPSGEPGEPYQVQETCPDCAAWGYVPSEGDDMPGPRELYE